FTGVWHLYVVTTYDGGTTWQSTDVTGSDPVQKGCIWLGGGSNTCRNLLDFMDAQIDKTGHIVVGFADGCTASCATGGAANYSAWATVAYQTGGDPLIGATTTTTQPPSTAPTLTATAGTGAVDLSWTAVSGATSYDVYRGTTAGGESTT